MRPFKLSLLLCITVLFTSCMPEVSEIWYNKDGGVRAKSTLNIGESAGMIKSMFSEMATDAADQENTNIFDSINGKDNIDTAFSMYHIMPDSVKSAIEDPKILENFIIGINMDKKQEIFKMSMEINYANQAEKQKLIETLNSVSKDGQQANDVASMFADGQADMDKGTITFDNISILGAEKKEMDEMYNSLDSIQYVLDHWDEQKDENGNPLDDVSKEMAKMMLGMLQPMFEARTKYIIHAPGKIISSNIKNATINGKTLTYDTSIRDLMEQSRDVDVPQQSIIKFKN